MSEIQNSRELKTTKTLAGTTQLSAVKDENYNKLSTLHIYEQRMHVYRGFRMLQMSTGGIICIYRPSTMLQCTLDNRKTADTANKQVTWLAITEVRSSSFGLVLHEQHMFANSLIFSSPEGYGLGLQFSIQHAYFVYMVWHCTGQHCSST